MEVSVCTGLSEAIEPSTALKERHTLYIPIVVEPTTHTHLLKLQLTSPLFWREILAPPPPFESWASWNSKGCREGGSMYVCRNVDVPSLLRVARFVGEGALV